MKIHAYILCYNEEAIIRFTLDHYSQFCSKIFVLDNMSTDRSASIAKTYKNVIVLPWSSNNQMDDSKFVDLKAGLYKKYSRVGWFTGEVADWVITCDMDELIYHPRLLEKLESYEKDNITVANVCGFDMVSETWPSDGIPVTKQIRTGFRSPGFDKPIVFQPSFEMTFSVGCHPRGPSYEQMKKQPGYKMAEDRIYLLHYKHIGDRFIDKAQELGKRLSEKNIKNKWAIHYLQSTQQLSQTAKYIRRKAEIVIADSGEVCWQEHS